MRKPLKITLIVVPVVLLVGLVVLYFSLGAAVKAGANRALPPILGTNCALRNVDVSLLGGKIGIGGLVVGNPEGYHTDSAFELNDVTVTFEPGSVFSDTLHIREIIIDGPAVTYEQSLTGANNINEIRKHIQSRLPAKDGEAEEEPAKEEGGKKVVIDRFVLKNATVRLAGKQIKGLSAKAPLPTVELKDIGKNDGGIPVVEAVGMIFDVLTGGIEEVASLGFKAVGAGVDGAKDAAGAAIDEAGKTVDTAKDAGKKALDSVKGIFKKDD